jgi:hypothetical protein
MAEEVYDRDFFVKAGRRGGEARKSSLTEKERQKSARRAALARWRKSDPLKEGTRVLTKLLIKQKQKERTKKAEQRKAAK